MPLLRLRVTGSEDDVRAIANLLQSLHGVVHVEEIDDLMPGMREDSSSSDSISDSEGHSYCIEVDAANDQLADTVRGSAEVIAHDRAAGIEFVDEF